MTYQTVMGLEVHAQLKTKSKLFSSAPTLYGSPPNTQANFVDAGFPGTLPVLNKEAIRLAIIFGLAIEAKINTTSFFDRKIIFIPICQKGIKSVNFVDPSLNMAILILTVKESSLSGLI